MSLSCCICTCLDSVHEGPDESDVSDSDGDPTAFKRRIVEWEDRHQECWKTSVQKRGTETEEEM